MQLFCRLQERMPEGEVDTIFSNEKVSITKEIIEKTPENFTIYSGIGTSLLREIRKTTNRKLVKLFDRDDVAIYNSIPTVEGTLMMVIQHTDYTIHGSNIMVLGFGRTGNECCKSLSIIRCKSQSWSETFGTYCSYYRNDVFSFSYARHRERSR